MASRYADMVTLQTGQISYSFTPFRQLPSCWDALSPESAQQVWQMSLFLPGLSHSPPFLRSWQQKRMQRWRSASRQSRCPSWATLPEQQLLRMLKIPPTQKEQQESISLFVRPLYPPNSVCRCDSHSTSRDTSNSSNRPSNANAATPQKVNPPWASPPITFEIPPSWLCESRTVSATPSRRSVGRLSVLVMSVTMKIARRSHSPSSCIINFPPFLHFRKNWQSFCRSSRSQASGPSQIIARKAAQVGARCGSCIYPPPNPSEKQQPNAFFMRCLSSCEISWPSILAEWTQQQCSQGWAFSKWMTCSPSSWRMKLMYLRCRSVSTPCFGFILIFRSDFSISFTSFYVCDITHDYNQNH